MSIIKHVTYKKLLLMTFGTTFVFTDIPESLDSATFRFIISRSLTYDFKRHWQLLL